MQCDGRYHAWAPYRQCHLLQCLDFPSFGRISLLKPKGLWSLDILYKNTISTFSFLAGLLLGLACNYLRALCVTLAESQRTCINQMWTLVMDVSGLYCRTQNNFSISILVTLTPDHC